MAKQFDNPFQDFDIGAIEGATIMKKLRLGLDDLSIPERSSKIKEIFGYLKNHPERDYILSMISRKDRGADGLDYAWGYVKLREKTEALKKEYNRGKEELVAYEE